MSLTLTQRLSAVFSLLLLACCGVSAWLQVHSSVTRQEEVIQGLSRGLAAHIAASTALMDTGGLRPDAVRNLFGQLMVVNPSVEVYLLDAQGRITGDDAPPGHIKRDRVDLAPVRRFLAGASLPILDDDPRSVAARKVFSAAPLRDTDGRPLGYIYVILLGETRDALAARAAATAVLRNTLRSMALVAVLGLAAGLIAFRSITRPLRRLAEALSGFDPSGDPARQPALAGSPAGATHSAGPERNAKDEIKVLQSAFAQMATRIGEQYTALARSDQQRRELVANISHDLRTPLTSLHGYLELLALKGDALSASERQRYLGTALAQSDKVGKLAQSLFELARLEYGNVAPQWEDFSLPDLIQDVLQKFELAAGGKRIALEVAMPQRLPNVRADLAMIERVLTNLIDNAIRHTPEGGTVRLELAPRDDRIAVTVADTGPGIAPQLRAGLFQRALRAGEAHRGGLGLLLVQRMLQLQGSEIRLLDREGRGAVFEFLLQGSR
ncbi:MAG: sensor histidine kinase [Steroidobacteraceae bacterium]